MRDELIQFLYDYTYQHYIGLDYGPYKPTLHSCAIPEQRRIIVNSNWENQNEVPFSFAHEIGHIMNGDTGIRYYDSGTINSKSEYHANIFGIKLLLSFCNEHDIHFTNPVKFCEHFGVPFKLDYIVATMMEG